MQSKASSQRDRYNQNKLLSPSRQFAQPRLKQQNAVRGRTTSTTTSTPVLSSHCISHRFLSSQSSRIFHAGAFQNVTMWA